MYSFEELQVWKDAMDLVELIYKESKNFPKEERFGIISQLQRAVVSIPLNIAEGKGRHYDKVFVQFLYQARGSLFEVITLLKLSNRLNYLCKETTENILKECDKVSAKINNLIKAIKP